MIINFSFALGVLILLGMAFWYILKWCFKSFVRNALGKDYHEILTWAIGENYDSVPIEEWIIRLEAKGIDLDGPEEPWDNLHKLKEKWERYKSWSK